MFKTPQEWADALNSITPSVTVNKNGYELRTKILEFAQTNVWQDYHAKLGQFETSVTQDEETDEVVTTVSMPKVPGIDAVLETAEKFYAFVNNSNQTQKK